MKSRITIYLIFVALMVLSCAREEVQMNDDRVPLILDVSPEQQTRSIAEDATAFEVGDKIAVSAHLFRNLTTPIASRDLFLRGEKFSKVGSAHPYYDSLREYFVADDAGEIYLFKGVYYDFFATYPNNVVLNTDLSVTVGSGISGVQLPASGGGQTVDNDLMTGRQLDYSVDLNQTATVPSITLSHRLAKVKFSIVKNQTVTDDVVVKGIAFNSDILSRTWNQITESWLQDASADRTTTSIVGDTPSQRYLARNIRLDLSATPYQVNTTSEEFFAETLLLPEALLTDICVLLEVTPSGGGTTTTKYMKVAIDLDREIRLKQGKITQINLGYNTTNIVYIIHVYTKNWEAHPDSGSGTSGGAADDQYDL